MSGKKFNCFNKAEVCGVVTDFKIKSFPNGTKLANIAVKDENTTNLTYVSIFDRKGLEYGKESITLEGLKKVFMTGDNKSRGVYAKFTGRARESVSMKEGQTKTYFNISAFNVEPYSEYDEHYAILIVNGFVDAIKIAEDSDDNQYVKIKVGLENVNKDGNIIGVDYVTVISRESDIIEKLEDVDRYSFVRLQCDILNTLPKTDRFGNIIASGAKENYIVNIPKNGVVLSDDIDEDVISLYKQAKKLEKGEIIELSSNKDESEDDTQDDLDDDLDF